MNHFRVRIPIEAERAVAKSAGPHELLKNETGTEIPREEFLETSEPAVRKRKRWGVILAGGDGTRLRRLTRLICGDERPKQFCPLVGTDTLLEQTRLRAERSIPAEQLVVALSRSHRPFYIAEHGIRSAQRVIQPSNKGTAPAILYSLLSIERNDDDAIVAILPADHHYAEELTFHSALESAFDVATQRTGSVVLLGAPPDGPEVEYGWIELGSSLAIAEGSAFHVCGFFEKPSIDVAKEMLRRGSLWNTFVMVGHVRAFLEMLAGALPDLVDLFRSSRTWTGAELHISDSFYECIDPVDFSRKVLSLELSRLAALRLPSKGWSDLGHPERVIAALRAAGLEPRWVSLWQTQSSSEVVVDPLGRAVYA